MRVSRDVFFGLWAAENLVPGRPVNRRTPFDLRKIGNLLKSAREERGLTHDEVTGVLMIRRQVLDAIEAGEWDGLPSAVYVKGYVMQYASFLDIVDLVQPELSFAEEPLSAA